MTVRLLIEALGWILAVIGAYFIFSDRSAVWIHYGIFIAGVVLVIIYIPKNLRKK